MADLVTDNLALPKPKATNQLSVDVERLRTALDGIDAAVATKAASSTLTAHTGNTSNPHGTTAAQVGAIPASAGAVTDAYLGNRTVDPTTVPGGNTGTLTALLSGLSNRVRAITGATNWFDTPATTLAVTKAHIDSASNPHSTTAAQIGAIPSTNGSVTDALVGTRTVNPDLASPASTGTITQLLSWITGRIRAITGTANWFDTPATTLAGAATHQGNTSNPHSTTAAQVATASGFGSGAWGISISGNAGTATKFATARTINGVSFDGTANIEIPVLKTMQTINLDASGQTLSSGGEFGAGARYKDYPISSVNPAKCLLNVVSTAGSSLGINAERSGVAVDTKLSLVNGTTLRVSLNNVNATTWNIMGSVQVIEFQ